MRILLVSILVALLSVFVFLLGERKKEIEGERGRERERETEREREFGAKCYTHAFMILIILRG